MKLQLCIQLMLPEHLKHNPNILHMHLSILAEITVVGSYL